jgi:lysophospholipid acyltransferase (LPLAT)-like uncharacterized protein
MMIPLISLKFKKLYPNYCLMTLASKHGDGRFVGKVTEKFGMISVLGSSKDGRKSSRGIDFSSMRKIVEGLRKGDSLAITPDGPRGPNQKVNGELINIARLTGAKILPISCHSSRCLQLNTWDKLKIPLPFSSLFFCFDSALIAVNKSASKEEVAEIKLFTEQRLNFVQQESFEIFKE